MNPVADSQRPLRGGEGDGASAARCADGALRRGPVSPALKLAGKAALTIVVTLCFLEATTRVYCFGWDAFNYRKISMFRGTRHSNLIQPSPDPSIPYELKPNLDGYYQMKRFATNSRGLRDREHAFVKPLRTFRVVVVGASYAMGSGVEQEEAFHRVLEERLNRAGTGPTWELINMSVGGYSPQDSLAVLDRKAWAYQPDLILFTTTPHMYAPDRTQARRIVTASNRYVTSYFALLLELKMRALWQKAKAWWSKPGNDPRHPDAVELARASQRVDVVFARLGEIQGRTGIPVYVVVLTHIDRWTDLIEEMDALARRHALGFIDASEPLRRAGFPDTCTNVFDCHPNAQAHRVFADAAFDALLNAQPMKRTTGTRGF